MTILKDPLDFSITMETWTWNSNWSLLQLTLLLLSELTRQWNWYEWFSSTFWNDTLQFHLIWSILHLIIPATNDLGISVGIICILRTRRKVTDRCTNGQKYKKTDVYTIIKIKVKKNNFYWLISCDNLIHVYNFWKIKLLRLLVK